MESSVNIIEDRKELLSDSWHASGGAPAPAPNYSSHRKRLHRAIALRSAPLSMRAFEDGQSGRVDLIASPSSKEEIND